MLGTKNCTTFKKSQPPKQQKTIFLIFTTKISEIILYFKINIKKFAAKIKLISH